MPNSLIKVENLSKVFKIKSSKLFEPPKSLKAVNDVSFEIYEGETFGIIGESGSGKSTLGKAVLRLIEPTSGKVLYKDKSLLDFSPSEMKAIRKEIQVVFQDPYSSLDPRKTVGYLVEEPLAIHGIGNDEERKKRVKELFELVGLNEAHAIRYPHEFSGGQRQRICIARALALNPTIIVADEPVSALDVSVQAQVINLLKDLQKKLNLTYLFISHDLSVVKYISNRIAIMYLGRIVEIGDSKSIYDNPLHPYTQTLFSAIPAESPFDQSERIALSGEIPSPINLPKGCAFASRCPKATEACKEVLPELKEIENGHKVACILFN
ncbi:dipeptide ABC transporter ATP-binding protein [Clostridium bovifaecis]|uniref:Dipeptide ABC transporter ATP-binding protein n=1 Tax=Clostridium bovifaecis TaxID=2184719 RepID=A0A6I6F0V4_9CLOT|nr:dipeptide ABC transporter ATP-binding protein [Clostridium bovifaecis]